MHLSHFQVRFPCLKKFKLNNCAFTDGPKICLGYRYAMMFMKIFLANFLSNYKIETNLKFEELDMKLAISSKIFQPANIVIRKR